MSRNPYDYENRQGILPVSWNDFHGLCRTIALAVAPWQPELILPIGRAGYYPGTLLAHMLQAEVYPVRLSRRVRDVVEREHPAWLLEPPALVHGRRALIVDEISSSGETLTLAKQRVLELGAAEVRTAVLYAHSWGTAVPDYIGFVSDALIMNPWDREVVRDGELVFHPEYAAALAEQGLAPDPGLLIEATRYTPAKKP